MDCVRSIGLTLMLIFCISAQAEKQGGDSFWKPVGKSPAVYYFDSTNDAGVRKGWLIYETGIAPRPTWRNKLLAFGAGASFCVGVGCALILGSDLEIALSAGASSAIVVAGTMGALPPINNEVLDWMDEGQKLGRFRFVDENGKSYPVSAFQNHRTREYPRFTALFENRNRQVLYPRKDSSDYETAPVVKFAVYEGQEQMGNAIEVSVSTREGEKQYPLSDVRVKLPSFVGPSFCEPQTFEYLDLST